MKAIHILNACFLLVSPFGIFAAETEISTQPIPLPGSSAKTTPPVAKSRQLVSPDQVPEGLAKSDWTSIRAAYEAGRHAFQPVEGGWQARNPGQQWTMKFDGRGFTAEPKGGGWQWGLELKSYGFPDAENTISGAATVKAEGQRLHYDWDAALQEWFVNDARGLEHGFTVRRKPSGAAAKNPLQFDLAVRGSLEAKIDADGQGMKFCDAAGAVVLNYSGLKVWDANGQILSTRFESSNTSVRLMVDEHGARYPLTIDPIAQQAYLKAGNTGANDMFGYSVAVAGDTVVIGAPYEDSGTTDVNSTPNELARYSGAAYVFMRSGTTWSQQAYLKASNTGANDMFGWSVAVAGDTVVIGAPYEDSGTTGVNSTPDDSANGAGAAYIFVRSGSTWSQQAYLKDDNTRGNKSFGWSVAVAGDTVVIGAPYEDSGTTGANSTPDDSADGAGAAYVFTRSGTAWSQQAYLKAGNIGGGDAFGLSVAVAGDTVVVGAFYEDSSTTGVNSTPNELASGAGAAYVFVRSGTTWSQQAYLKASNTGANDMFGWSVAVAGDTVVIGAPYEDSGTTGVNSTPNESASSSGAAYIFVRSGSTWSQQAYLKASNNGANDYFGYSVAVSGDTLVIGARDEDSSTTGVNSTPNELASGAGAAYIFEFPAPEFVTSSPLPEATTGVAYTQALAAIGGTSPYTWTIAAGSLPDELILTSDGMVTGTPASAGTFVFTVRVTGADGASATKDFSLTIHAVVPIATTEPATAVTPDGATLHGTVTSNGAATEVIFEYSTDPALGSGVTTTSPPEKVASSASAMAVSRQVTGLTGHTLYHFRISGTNAAGTSPGSILSFTTPNSIPAATAQSGLLTDEDTAKEITVSGTDADEDSLAYTVAAQPMHGTVTISGSTATYIPAPDYHGPDSFAFTAGDSFGGTSEAALVSLTVTPVNDRPTVTLAGPSTVTLEAGGIYTEQGAVGSDVEDGTITPVITGTVNATLPGAYPVSYTVTDSGLLTASVTRTVNVVDTTAPTIAAPAGGFTPLTLTAGSDGMAILPDYTSQAVTTDVVGVTSVIQTPAAGTAIPAGTTSVSMVARDAAGNTSAELSFHVTVVNMGFQNGSFEINGGNDSAMVTAWTLANGGGLVALNTEGCTDGSFAVGFNVGNQNSGGILSQAFATLAGQTYRVTFDFGAYSSNGVQTQLSQLLVEVRDGASANSGSQRINAGSGRIVGTTGGALVSNGTTIQVKDQSASVAVTGPAPNAEFSVVTFTFTAQSSMSTLVFTDQSTGGIDNQDPMLDNVRIAPAVPNDSTLSTLTLSSGTLWPAFAPTTTAYSSVVGNEINLITITPTPADALALVKVNGAHVTTGSPSAPIPLSVGGNTIMIEITASDQVSTTTYAIVVTREPALASAYETWKRNHFVNPEDLADASISGDHADPDHDGIPNLLECAFALEPKTADVAANLPTAGNADGYLTFTYRQSKAATDFSFTVESSTNLTSGAWSESGFIETAREDMGDFWLVTVRHELSTTSAPARFVRLQVETLSP